MNKTFEFIEHIEFQYGNKLDTLLNLDFFTIILGTYIKYYCQGYFCIKYFTYLIFIIYLTLFKDFLKVGKHSWKFFYLYC